MEVARNLRRFIDRVIDDRLMPPGQSGDPHAMVGRLHRLLTERNLLDDRTVLLAWFLPDPEHLPGDVVLLSLTRDRSSISVTVPDGPVSGGTAPEHNSVRQLVADDVRRVREEIVADPLFLELTPDARHELSRNDHLIGDPRAFEGWRRQGKDRLILWPHGPLHYFPFQLCSVAGRTIADDWTVVTIPSLDSLLPSARDTRPPRTAVIASASGGAGFGLTVEESLERHAHEVAETAGVAAITGGAATRSRLLRELSVADVIHIATHGTHDVAAPWFHCLYLSPDQDDDGRVFAHDLLTADLRGVRLVTLAACESALGRFDLNDNLRGIPGALLTAGAEAVVGCLWPVRPEPATAFFADMYGRLGSGDAVVDAFRKAQLATRSRYPQYRDWGSFSLISARITDEADS